MITLTKDDLQLAFLIINLTGIQQRIGLNINQDQFKPLAK